MIESPGLAGPAAALFAATNPGGTIDLVTKEPLAVLRQALSITAGSFATYRAAADFTGPVNGVDALLYRLNVGYENTESFRFLQGHESYLVAPSISFLPSARTRVNGDLVYAYRDGVLDRGQTIFFGNTDLTSPPTSFSLSQPGDYMITKDFSLTLSLQHAFTDWLTFNAALACRDRPPRASLASRYRPARNRSLRYMLPPTTCRIASSSSSGLPFTT